MKMQCHEEVLIFQDKLKFGGESMTDTIFSFLNQIGFTHPLHPAFTHVPMGMVMGAVFFVAVLLYPFSPRLKY